MTKGTAKLRNAAAKATKNTELPLIATSPFGVGAPCAGKQESLSWPYRGLRQGGGASKRCRLDKMVLVLQPVLGLTHQLLTHQFG